MWKSKDRGRSQALSDAEDAATVERNQAALGKQWQERPARPRSDVDKAMDIWRAKAAYDAQNALPLVVLVALFLLLAFLATLFR